MNAKFWKTKKEIFLTIIFFPKIFVCGLRGGYAELYNWDPAIKAEFMKLLSARLCPTVLGQAAMDCVVKPPEEGSESYPLFYFEKRAILKGLKEKAKLTAESFNKIDGISCQPIQGAMYWENFLKF